MPDFAHIGDFCPNEACPDRGKLQVDRSRRNIEKAGKTKKGKQRYQCKTVRLSAHGEACGRTFTETKGAIFYQRCTPESEIIEILRVESSGRSLGLGRRRGPSEHVVDQGAQGGYDPGLDPGCRST